MTALDELERQLARAVDAGAAADPGRASAALADLAAAHESPAAHEPASSLAGAATTRSRRSTSRRRPRRPWHVLVVFLLAGGVTTGALAATGQLPVFKASPEALAPNPRQFAGVREGNTELLPLRVADPAGGPPWALRTFRTNRGAACVQAGQVQDGAFGLAERTTTGKRILRRVKAQQGASNAMCSGLERDGFPVLRGARHLIRDGTPKRALPGGMTCSEVRGGCDVASIASLRFGLLGPGAREARFLLAGQVRGTQQIAAGTGGAYLFVVPRDPAPFEAYERLQEEVDAPFRRGPRSEPLGSDDLRDDMREQRRRWKAARPKMAPLERAMKGGEAIEATFEGGRTIIVAGTGREGGRLPGITAVKSDLPASVAAEVTAKQAPGGPRAPIVVSFRSPIALTRFDRHFVTEIRGPVGPGCDTEAHRGRHVTTTSFERGAWVRITLQPYQYDGERQPWCTRPQRIVVTLTTGSSIEGGRPVGETTITPRG